MSWIEERKNIKNNIFRRDVIKMENYPNKEFNNYYKEKYPDSNLNTLQTNSIIKAFIEAARDEIEEKRDGFEISSFGHMIVISRPLTEDIEIINFKKSYEADEKRRELNLHSAGRLCKVIFSFKSKKYKIKNKRLWTFRYCKDFRNRISKVFRKNYTRYLRVYKYGNIAKRLMDY